MNTMTRLPAKGALAALAVAACGAFGGAAAQTTPSRTAPATTETAQVAQQLPRAERRFLEDAAVGGLAEVELGKLGKMARDAKDAQVRDFASRTLATLQEHLRLARTAEDAAKKVG